MKKYTLAKAIYTSQVLFHCRVVSHKEPGGDMELMHKLWSSGLTCTSQTDSVSSHMFDTVCMCIRREKNTYM